MSRGCSRDHHVTQLLPTKHETKPILGALHATHPLCRRCESNANDTLQRSTESEPIEASRFPVRLWCDAHHSAIHLSDLSAADARSNHCHGGGLAARWSPASLGTDRETKENFSKRMLITDTRRADTYALHIRRHGACPGLTSTRLSVGVFLIRFLIHLTFTGTQGGGSRDRHMTPFAPTCTQTPLPHTHNMKYVSMRYATSHHHTPHRYHHTKHSRQQ